MKRHYPAIRGLAIFLVIVHHSIVLGASIPGEWGYPQADGVLADTLGVVSLLGWIAVPAFLFISGSFYAYAARGEPPQISLKLVIANLTGILWPYLVWSLVYYLIEMLGKGTSYTIFGIIKNLFVGYPFHFVPLIVFFILISPLMLKVAQRIGWAWVLGLIALYQLFLIFTLDSRLYGLYMPEWTNYLVVPVLSRTLADWGIYFPLGLCLTLNTKVTSPILEKTRWIFAILFVFFFALAAAHVLRVVRLPFTRHLYPLMFVLLTPALKREWIPARKFFESIGKYAYGIYLIHLVFILAFLLLLRSIFPWLLGQPYLLDLLIFCGALFIPLYLIKWLTRSRFAKASPYLVG